MFRLYFDNNIYQNSTGWLDLIITLLGTLIGAGIGFWGAMYIQKKQEKKLSSQKLTLFYNLSNDTVIVLRKLIPAYENLIQRITTEPYESHLALIPASSDIERVHYLLKNEIFSSLVLILGNEAIDYYKKARTNIDYLFMANNELLKMNEKHVDFVFQDQCFISDSVDNIVNILIKRSEEIRTSKIAYKNNKEFQYCLELFAILDKLNQEATKKNNINLNGFKTFFIEELLGNSTSKLEKTTALEINDIAKKASNRLKRININSMQFIQDCKSYCETIKTQTDLMDSYNETLKTFLKS